MKVILEQAELSEPEVIIRGNAESEQVRSILSLLSGKQTLQKMFFFREEKEYLFDIAQVSYFEAENNKIFAFVGNERYEVRHKLYEIEAIGRMKGFVRINKGVVVNINFAESVEAEFSGNYTLHIAGTQRRLTISRKYVKDFRRYVMEVY